MAGSNNLTAVLSVDNKIVTVRGCSAFSAPGLEGAAMFLTVGKADAELTWEQFDILMAAMQRISLGRVPEWDRPAPRAPALSAPATNAFDPTKWTPPVRDE